MEKRLTELQARGMTVNERLWAIGLFDEFYQAEHKRDENTMRSILEKLHLGPNNVEAIIENARNKYKSSDQE